MIPSKAMLIILAFIVLPVYSKKINNNGYMLLERVVVEDVNHELLNMSVRTDKINRTSYAMNMNFSYLKDPPPLHVTVKIYGLYGNEYKPAPIVISRNICDFYNYEFQWVAKQLTDSTCPTKCPLKKGDYYIRNYMPNANVLPFVSPWTNLKFIAHFYEVETKKTFCKFILYGKLDYTQEIIKGS